jgi:hypothetical protein
MSQVLKLAITGSVLAASMQPAHAQTKKSTKDEARQLVKCEESIGSITLIDGDQAG